MKKILLFAFLARFLFLFGGYHPDLGNHLDWGIRFWQYGPKKFYDASVWSVSWPNQPPGTVYLWAIMARLKEILWAALWWVNINIRLFPSNLITFLENRLHPALVKLPSVLAEIGLGWLIYLIVRKLKDDRMARWASIIFLFNPIAIYNSAVWGQTEGVINFFGLAAVYFLLCQKPILGTFSYAVSLYFKPSLIIFAPIILLLLFKGRYRSGKLFASLVIPVLALSVFSFPFMADKNVFQWFLDFYLFKVFARQGNMLTANAFNFWALVLGINLARTDQGQFLAFNFRQWGQLIFFFLNLPVVLSLVFKKIKEEDVFLALVLFAFSAFLFLTNMHERYLYPLFPPLAILVGLYPGLIWLFGLLSLIHFFNLYHLWFYPKIDFLVGLLTKENQLLIRIASLILVCLYFYFLRLFLKNHRRVIK
jgi:hypothetical protein